MQIINIEPRDIHVTIDLSITEIKKILTALERAKIDYNGRDEPGMEKASECLKLFFNLLAEVEENVEQNERTAM